MDCEPPNGLLRYGISQGNWVFWVLTRVKCHYDKEKKVILETLHRQQRLRSDSKTSILKTLDKSCGGKIEENLFYQGKLATQRAKEESCDVVCESVLGLGLPDGLQELLIEQICGQQQRNAALHTIPQEAHTMSLVDPLHDVCVSEVLIGLHCCGEGVQAVAEVCRGHRGDAHSSPSRHCAGHRP